ncbi:MAG: hypothetical protein JKY53_12520 [Flavobacteriales bacterium]|nr:hypothetical protein [Flavobacteriales bacterium]
MDWLNSITHILMLAIPAGIFSWTALAMWKKYLEYIQKKHEVSQLERGKNTNAKTILPLKMQSYERIVLFLERIAPENLIIRVHEPGMSAKQLHRKLVDGIQQEYEHNLSQQVYVSIKGWEVARTAKEDTLHIVNLGINKMNEKATGLELSQEIFQTLSKLGQSPSKPAIDAIKRELKQYI